MQVLGRHESHCNDECGIFDWVKRAVGIGNARDIVKFCFSPTAT
jgi:hypothetical protein